jgi:predicted RNA polymerase sigma factor
LLLEHPLGATPATYALTALMYLNAARLPARVDAAGDLNSLADQDRSKWDKKLVSEGLNHLDLAASGPSIAEYHVEAAISSVHASATRLEDTNWDEIVSLYDMLMNINRSPIVALNRAIAIAQRDGPEHGLKDINTIADADRLRSYPFYAATLGELELRRGESDSASAHFLTAIGLARNEMERRFLKQRLSACERAG